MDEQQRETDKPKVDTEHQQDGPLPLADRRIMDHTDTDPNEAQSFFTDWASI